MAPVMAVSGDMSCAPRRGSWRCAGGPHRPGADSCTGPRRASSCICRRSGGSSLEVQEGACSQASSRHSQHCMASTRRPRHSCATRVVCSSADPPCTPAHRAQAAAAWPLLRGCLATCSPPYTVASAGVAPYWPCKKHNGTRSRPSQHLSSKSAGCIQKADGCKHRCKTRKLSQVLCFTP